MRGLRERLVALHAVLLAYERNAYEETHGPTDAATLLRLLVEHEQFAWLRSLSGMIARIDEAMEVPPPVVEASAAAFFQEAHGLLRSDGGLFARKYHEALQRSPEVVMAHAEMIRVLAASRGPDVPSQEA